MSKKKKEWKAEKARLLSLGQEERRKEYGDYMALDKIPTWRNHHGREPEEEEIFVSLCDKVSLYKGDITILEVDAIVNAANASLLGGGGVDGCIHRAAGHHLYEECHSLNGCDTGKAKITCGYELPAKYVIHTVGPIARGNVGQVQKDDLASCYKNSLKLVEEHNLHSVAFPCISTGIYGFPNEPAANIALDTVRNWLKENKNKIDRIIFCVFLEHDYQIYNRKMSDYFPTDNEECEEGDAVAHADDDANKNDPDDVHMDSQADSDVDMQSQRDMDPEPPNTPSQPAETCTSASETTANEMTSEQRDPVEDKNSAEDSKPKQKSEEDEEKKDDLEEADDIAGGEKEKGAGEKTENAPAETKPEEEEAQVTSMNSKDTDSQGLVETMEIEGAENEDQIKTTDNSKSEGEAKHQDKCLAGTNQASQSDSSQSKDGPSDKGEPSKE